MSIFDSLGGQRQQPAQSPQNSQQMQQARQQFNADPVGILRKCGLNIPDGMTDPQQITMHLFQSGQLGRNGMRVRR